MTLPQIVDQNGRSIPLERQLGSGGEGNVFALSNDPNRVAKVYHQPTTMEKTAKLASMARLANPKLIAIATWPNDLIYHALNRQVAGFLMPRLPGDYKEIWQLYNPIERVKVFPNANWAFQVRSAQNLAAAFDEVHQTGCIIADVQLKNALVSKQALIRLVDCDSFQVIANGKQHLCDVGLEHYIPPELQGKNLRGLVRTENHDRFGLAVLIYQLLFVGRHPYAGIYRGSGDPPFQQLMSEYRFAQGPLAPSWGMSPPPHTPTFADIPFEVGVLFRRAFERGSEKGTRPKPTEWIAALKELEQSIVTCSADAGHKFWKGSNGCVWCRLALNGGPEYYYGVAESGGPFAVDEARLQEVIRRLETVVLVAYTYNASRFQPVKQPIATAVPEQILRLRHYPVENDEEEISPTLADWRDHQMMSTVLIGLSIVGVLVMPLGFYRLFLGCIGLLIAMIFLIWFLLHYQTSPYALAKSRLVSIRARNRHAREKHEQKFLDALNAEADRRNRVLAQTQDRVNGLEAMWHKRVHEYGEGQRILRTAISGALAECRELAAQYRSEVQRLTANAESTSRLRHLRLHLLTDATITSIGAGRKQILAFNGIVTAADIEESAIRRISGFGDTLTSVLINWRSEVLAKFRFNPIAALSPAEMNATSFRYTARQKVLLDTCENKIQQLAGLTPACTAFIEQLKPELQSAFAHWYQAHADCQVISKMQEGSYTK